MVAAQAGCARRSQASAASDLCGPAKLGQTRTPAGPVFRGRFFFFFFMADYLKLRMSQEGSHILTIFVFSRF